MKSKSKYLPFITLLLLTLGLGACGESSEQSSGESQLSAQPVSFDITDWGDGWEQFILAMYKACADLSPDAPADTQAAIVPDSCIDVLRAMVNYAGFRRAQLVATIQMDSDRELYSPERQDAILSIFKITLNHILDS